MYKSYPKLKYSKPNIIAFIHTKISTLRVDENVQDELIELYEDYYKYLRLAYDQTKAVIPLIHENQYDLKIKYDDQKSILECYKIHSDYIDSYMSSNIINLLYHNADADDLTLNMELHEQYYIKNQDKLEKNYLKYNFRGALFSGLSCAIGCLIAIWAQLFGGCVALLKSSSCSNNLVTVISFVTVIVSIIAFFGTNFYRLWKKDSYKKSINDLNKLKTDFYRLKMSSKDLLNRLISMKKKIEMLNVKLFSDPLKKENPICNDKDFYDQCTKANDEFFKENLKNLGLINKMYTWKF
jgi:hypothetical protein